MERDFLPAKDPKENPLTSSNALMFTGDGRWLIGADFTLMSTLTCAFVFNDPDLYGFRIAILAGGKIQALAGLEFELLYKKVTDTIGVYQIELKLPDALRQIQLGAVALTLPIIDIDIYTNGNFRVDMGFPGQPGFQPVVWSAGMAVHRGRWILLRAAQRPDLKQGSEDYRRNVLTGD